jgi:hypothetical protein
MDESTARVLKEIRAEFELTGTVRAQQCLRDHPEMRVEIEDQVRSLLGSVPPTDRPLDVSPDDGVLARRFLAEKTRERRHRMSSQLHGEMASRQVPSPPTVAPKDEAERRAQLYAWATDVLSRAGKQITRLTVQKAVYLLSRLRPVGLQLTFEPNIRGPYSRELADAGDRAAGRGWVKSVRPKPYHVERGEALAASDAPAAIRRHLGDTTADERLLAFLGGLDDLELEVWATVDMAACNVIQKGGVVSVAAVKAEIEAERLWSPKKGIKKYSEAQIRDALDNISRLGLLRPEELELG